MPSDHGRKPARVSIAVAARAQRWPLGALWLTSTLVAVLLWVPAAQAQQWPEDDQWRILYCGLRPSFDPVADEPAATDERDVVGNSNDPAAYFFADADTLYFRMRLDDDAAFADETFRPFGWGVEMSIDDDRRDYELIVMLDGIDDPDAVVLSANTTQTRANDPSDSPEVEVQRYSASTHARAVPASGVFASNFGATPDFFVDVAVDWGDLVDEGVDEGTPLVLVMGTSSSADSLDADIICHDADLEPRVLTGVSTDPVRPDDTVVLDTDGDGLPDAEEQVWDTPPNDPDCDNDGFTDLEEIQAGTGPCDPNDHPPEATADSDGDGLTDADEIARGTDPNDADTDNDGVDDGAEVAAGTDPRDPNSVPSGVALRGGPGACSQAGSAPPFELGLALLVLLAGLRRRARQ